MTPKNDSLTLSLKVIWNTTYKREKSPFQFEILLRVKVTTVTIQTRFVWDRRLLN